VSDEMIFSLGVGLVVAGVIMLKAAIKGWIENRD